MTRGLLLDLYCGAGGCSEGYSRAGWEVVGVDLNPQPRYPFEFIQADALTFPLEGFDRVHASPPCQLWSTLVPWWKSGYPDLLYPTRDRLIRAGVPYVIENVPRAPLREPIILCGTMFPGLRVIRHRGFESNMTLHAPAEHPPHPLVFTLDRRKAHYGQLDQSTAFHTVTGGLNCGIDEARDAMGIDWMMRDELTQAIPPAYTEYIGNQIH